MIKQIENASRRWNGFIAGIGSIVIIAAIFLLGADVCGRYFFNKPIKGTTEILQWMMAWIVFLSMAYGLVKSTHVRVTLLFSRLSRRIQFILEVFTDVLGIIFFIFLTWGAIRMFLSAWKFQELMPAAIDIPYWPPKLMFVLGGILMLVQFLICFIQHLAMIFTKEGEE